MNHLEHIADFESVLRDYQPSEEAKQLLQDTKLVLLVGPTSSGRNTIINELIKSGHYHPVVSDTTRKPRINNGNLEQNGREYWFRDEQSVLQDLQAGKFLEAAIIHGQQVSGISIRELQAAAQEGKVAINEIEVVGADNIYDAKPDTTFLFILPPSFDEWMTRMQARGALPDDEVRRRLESAVKELTIGLDRDYYRFVVNNTFMHTAQAVDDLIMLGVQSEELQIDGRRTAQELLRDTAKYLA